jgi:hypothetical protein
LTLQSRPFYHYYLVVQSLWCVENSSNQEGVFVVWFFPAGSCYNLKETVEGR